MSIKITDKNGHSVEIGIMAIPYRKSKCLYKSEGARTYPLAYFRNEESAIECEKVFEMILKATGN